MRKQKESKRKQLRADIRQLEQLYGDYEVLTKCNYKPYVRYKVANLAQFLSFLVMSVLTMVAVSIIFCGHPPLPLAFVELPFICLACVILSNKCRDRYYTAKDWPKGTFVTFHVCSNKQAEKVRTAIKSVEAAIDQARFAQQHEQTKRVRDDFTAKYEAAKAVNPEFKILFDIIENELDGVVRRTLSVNDYGLVNNVIMTAEVSEILNDMEVFIPKFLCFGPFELNDGQLQAWKTYVAMLKSFKNEYYNIDKLLTNAHDNEPAID